MSAWSSRSAKKLPPARRLPITLLLAVFKFDRMEWAIEKCTELNVTSIVPVIARRTEKHLALGGGETRGALAAHRARSVGAVASSGASRDWRAGETGCGPRNCSGVAHRVVRSRARSAVERRSCAARSEAASLALAIGPEGGWTADELQLFTSAGWISASLGDTILRAETAAIAALAVAQAELN